MVRAKSFLLTKNGNLHGRSCSVSDSDTCLMPLHTSLPPGIKQV